MENFLKLDRMFWQWVVGILLLIWVIFSGSKLSDFQGVFNVIGLLLLSIGLLGRLYATLYIGGMKNTGNDGNSFVCDGIYRVCRNPLYFFSFVALLGLLSLKGQILLLIIGGVGFLLIYRFTILGEEKYLSQKFGESYQQFLKDTPRFFPDFSKFKYEDKLEIRLFYLHKELKSVLIWVIAAIFIYAVSILQILDVIPIFIYSY